MVLIKHESNFNVKRLAVVWESVWPGRHFDLLENGRAESERRTLPTSWIVWCILVVVGYLQSEQERLHSTLSLVKQKKKTDLLITTSFYSTDSSVLWHDYEIVVIRFVLHHSWNRYFAVQCSVSALLHYTTLYISNGGFYFSRIGILLLKYTAGPNWTEVQPGPTHTHIGATTTRGIIFDVLGNSYTRLWNGNIWMKMPQHNVASQWATSQWAVWK